MCSPMSRLFGSYTTTPLSLSLALSLQPLNLRSGAHLAHKLCELNRDHKFAAAKQPGAAAPR